MTPSRELPRLAIAIAIPREVDGAAAVREGSEASMKTRENLKYISSRTINHIAGVLYSTYGIPRITASYHRQRAMGVRK